MKAVRLLGKHSFHLQGMLVMLAHLRSAFFQCDHHQNRLSSLCLGGLSRTQRVHSCPHHCISNCKRVLSACFNLTFSRASSVLHRSRQCRISLNLNRRRCRHCPSHMCPLKCPSAGLREGTCRLLRFLHASNNPLYHPPSPWMRNSRKSCRWAVRWWDLGLSRLWS